MGIIHIYVGEYASYRSGGYAYEFRAVFIQFTLYNSNVELFTSLTFLLEFLSTTSIYPTVRLKPINFSTFTSISQLICTILYMIMIIYLMIIEIRLSFKEK
ncbi:hypothetical protein I4U23_030834 [Adineta vaga]|nr:hypothetical protein I4U23_030834 [Adineta vaga]